MMKKISFYLIVIFLIFLVTTSCLQDTDLETNSCISSESYIEEVPQFYSLPESSLNDVSNHLIPMAYRSLDADEQELYHLVSEIRQGNVQSGYFDMEYDIKKIANVAKANYVDFFPCEPYVHSAVLTKSGAFLKFEVQKEYFSKDMILLQKQAAEDFFENLSADADDFDKIYYIATELSRQVRYDHDAAEGINSGIPLKRDEQNSLWQSSYAYGALVNGKAVCTGYTRAFMYLCDMVDIHTIPVFGTTHLSEETGRHTWNKVYLDENWYVVDVTWFDVDSTNSLDWNFFLASDAMIAKTHKEGQPLETNQSFSGSSFFHTYPAASFSYEEHNNIK